MEGGWGGVQKKDDSLESSLKMGEADGARTHDPRHHKPVL